MEEITLDFLGEKVCIKKPKDLPLLRSQISSKFGFSEEDSSEIIIYYTFNNTKIYIKNQEDFSEFLGRNISIIYLDINSKSRIYSEIEKEIKSKEEIEKLKLKKEEIEKKEEEYLQSYNKNLKELNILIARRFDLLKSKKKKLSEFRNEKEKIEKKINEILLKKDNEVILKEKNYFLFDNFKETLDIIAEKIKYITNEYIFRKMENNNGENIEKIQNISESAVEDISNLSKLVTDDDINCEKNIKLKNGIKKERNDKKKLCKNCNSNNSKLKLNPLQIKISDGNKNICRGVKCKGCGHIIWDDN